jgi:hypothetical protein
MNNRHWFAYGFLAGVIVVLAALLAMRPASPAFAQAVPGGGSEETKGLIAFTGTTTKSGHFIYIVDATNLEGGDDAGARLAMYDPTDGKELKLVAVRNIRWDLKCWDYTSSGGTNSPPVKTVREGVEKRKKN